MSGSVAVVILAGGEGSRLGGNKALRKLGGVPLIDLALAHAKLWSDVVAVSLREPGQVQATGTQILFDEPHIAGPLAGLVSALRFGGQCGRDLVLTIPVDMPFLPPNLSTRLVSEVGDLGCALAKSSGHLHPVCGLWRVSVAGELAIYRSSGQRSLKGFAAQIGFREVEWSAARLDPFFNINIPADLSKAELHFAR